MFERKNIGDVAILVHLETLEKVSLNTQEELKSLTISNDIEVAKTIVAKRKAPLIKTFIGIGKIEELKIILEEEKANLVIFNNRLSPTQERNLEKILNVRVLDRITLILDIFAKRAKTYEGKLQVELAQLNHLSTKLIRGWTHLERQKGGIGLRGPGESQLETDRRLIGQRIKIINNRLKTVNKRRNENQKARKKNEFLNISLIGYTNTGKSSLFNLLTGSNIYAKNRLFATLDPSFSKLKVKGFDKIILADTVGFISNLPHELVKAFNSTLAQVAQANLLLHIIDVSANDYLKQIESVNLVLKNILKDKNIPTILVYNKIDKANIKPNLFIRENNITEVFLSVKENNGLSFLKEAIVNNLGDDLLIKTISLPFGQAKLRAYLFSKNFVTKEKIKTNHWEITILIAKSLWQELTKKYKNIA